MNNEINKNKIVKPSGLGKDRLWCYFGLSRASWLTLPRVMCHDMPDDWQNKMATLLEEWDETWVNQPNYGTRVQVTIGNKLVSTPDWLIDYRHPDRDQLAKMKVFPFLQEAQPNNQH